MLSYINFNSIKTINKDLRDTSREKFLESDAHIYANKLRSYDKFFKDNFNVLREDERKVSNIIPEMIKIVNNHLVNPYDKNNKVFSELLESLEIIKKNVQTHL